MTRALALLALALLLGPACQTTRIQPRPPIEVPAGLTPEHVELAILAALANETPVVALTPEDDGSTRIEATKLGALRQQRLSGDGWFPEASAPGAIDAGYTLGPHELHVRIHYTKYEVTVELLGSRALRQTPTSIHHGAYKWIGELELRIRRALGALSVVTPAGADPRRDGP